METKTKAQRIRSIYAIVYALFTVFVGFLLIKQVWTIYFSAESKPFSVASISAHFHQIQGFVWAWLAGLVVNAGWGIFVPDTEKKSKYVDYAAQMQKLCSRLPDGGKYALKGKKYPIIRYILWAACGAVILVGIAVCGYYLGSFYTPQMSAKFFAENDGAAERLLKILPWLGGVLLILVGAAIYDTFLLSKEVALVKQFVATEAKAKQGKGEGVKDGFKTDEEVAAYERACAKVSARRAKKQKEDDNEELQRHKRIAVWVARGILLCIGVTLFIVGICNGGMTDVFEKAKNICTQCIGLG